MFDAGASTHEDALPETPLAVGMTAEVYEHAPGRVLKLFFPWVSEAMAAHEERVARAVWSSGVPAPAVGVAGVWRGRRGIVYERIAGESLLNRMLSGKADAVTTHGATLASLHASILERSAPAGIPSVRERVGRDIGRARRLSDRRRRALLRLLDERPDGAQLCHGDFHPMNVLVSRSGVTAIDWMDAAGGPPAADVARTLLLFRTGPVHLKGAVPDSLAGALRTAYMDSLSRLLGAPDPDEVAAWLPLMAAARLADEVPGEAPVLRELVAGHGDGA